MCKWVKMLLPPLQHNVSTEAQSCLWRRYSQISRCGAKPVALSTREPLGVFNSLFCLSLLRVWMKPVCISVCVGMRVHYLSKSLQVYSFVLCSIKFYQGLSIQWIVVAVQVKLAKRCERHLDTGIMHGVSALTGAYKCANLRIKAPRIQL